jgi:hypothetical protein
VRSIKSVILGFGTFEEVKLYKARHLVEVTVARHPYLLEAGFGPLGYPETVHCDKHLKSSLGAATDVTRHCERKTADYAFG